MKRATYRAAALAALGAATFGLGVVCGAIGVAVVGALEAQRDRRRELGPRRVELRGTRAGVA